MAVRVGFKLIRTREIIQAAIDVQTTLETQMTMIAYKHRESVKMKECLRRKGYTRFHRADISSHSLGTGLVQDGVHMYFADEGSASKCKLQAHVTSAE